MLEVVVPDELMGLSKYLGIPNGLLEGTSSSPRMSEGILDQNPVAQLSLSSLSDWKLRWTLGPGTPNPV